MVVLLQSNKTKENLILELKKITNYYSESKTTYFEGKITDNNFIIVPIFSYGMKGKLRPIITGKIQEKEKKTYINLSFKLPKSLKILLISSCIINILILITMEILKDKYNQLPFINKTTEYIIFILFTVILFIIYYYYKKYKSIQILKKIL